MARSNKFKPSKALKPGQQPIHPSKASKSQHQAVEKPSTNPHTLPEDLDPDAHRTTRIKTSSKSWSDGDQAPRFVPPPPEPTLNTSPLDNLPPSLASLPTKYDIHTLTIKSHSKINAKVTQLLDLLENGFSLAVTDQKPSIVNISARAEAANKCISVVEIAKRELSSRKYRWRQFTGVYGVMEELARVKGAGNKNGKGVKRQDKQGGGVDEDMEDDEAAESEEEAFEILGYEKRRKVRAQPVMSIYMSRVAVPELKAHYGEQTSDSTTT